MKGVNKALHWNYTTILESLGIWPCFFLSSFADWMHREINFFNGARKNRANEPGTHLLAISIYRIDVNSFLYSKPILELWS